jgi:hypothetical protein
MRAILLVLLTVIINDFSSGQENQAQQNKQAENANGRLSDAEQKKLNAERLQQMDRLSTQVTGFVEVKGKREPLRRNAKPVLRFNDPSRAFQDGTVWVWGEKGRPQGLLAVERYNRGFWFVECVSMTTTRDQTITATLPHGLEWKCAQPGLTFKEIPNHDLPGKTEFRRLQQFKAIARRFRFRETYVGQDSELRLIARPIHRYSDSDTIADAALFVFSNGTNPEAVLVLECQKTESGHAWKFGVVRLSSAVLKGWLDRAEVFQSPQQQMNQVAAPYLGAPLPVESLKLKD